MAPNEETRKLFAIFFPEASKRVDAFRKSGHNLVHYSSAEAVVNILKSKTIWMRDISCMNDFLEAEYGASHLKKFLEGDEGKEFKAIVGKIHADLPREIESAYNQYRYTFGTDTYLTSLSEHTAEDDAYGKLSMWRAYSKTTGAAVVMKTSAVLAEAAVLPVFTLPVSYLSPLEIKSHLDLLVDSITANVAYLSTKPKLELLNYLFLALRGIALSTKHKSFQEEREWRILYSTTFAHADSRSKSMVKQTQSINGIPQTVYNICLDPLKTNEYCGVDFPTLIEKIIIGPTQFPLAVQKALVDALSEAGVQDARNKVVISFVPLRT